MKVCRIPPNLLLAFLKKLSLKHLHRLRRTCKDINDFIAENLNQLSLYSKESIIFGQDHISYISSITGSIISITDPLLQIRNVRFRQIRLILDFGAKYEERKTFLQDLLPLLKLSCSKLFVDCSRFQEDPESLKIISAIDFSCLFAVGEGDPLDWIKELPKNCTDLIINTLDKSFKNFEDLFKFRRFTVDDFIYDQGDEIVINFLMTVKKAKTTGNLMAVEFPMNSEEEYGPLDRNKLQLVPLLVVDYTRCPNFVYCDLMELNKFEALFIRRWIEGFMIRKIPNTAEGAVLTTFDYFRTDELQPIRFSFDKIVVDFSSLVEAMEADGGREKWRELLHKFSRFLNGEGKGLPWKEIDLDEEDEENEEMDDEDEETDEDEEMNEDEEEEEMDRDWEQDDGDAVMEE